MLGEMTFKVMAKKTPGQVAAFLLCGLLTIACASRPKCAALGEVAPLILVEHILGGEGLLVERIGVYRDGRLALSFTGQRESCGQLSNGQMTQLEAIVTELKALQPGSI
jgi:hypothetical protein